MKRFSENGARPVPALGGFNTQPFGRLGALVFQAHNSDHTLYWASLRAPTRIAGCAWVWPTAPRWENVSPKHALQTGLANGHRTANGQLENNGGCAVKMRVSFSLCAVACDAFQNGSQRPACAAIGSGCIRNPRTAERSGCTAAGPYPPSRRANLIRFRRTIIGKTENRK